MPVGPCWKSGEVVAQKTSQSGQVIWNLISLDRERVSDGFSQSVLGDFQRAAVDSRKAVELAGRGFEKERRRAGCDVVLAACSEPEHRFADDPQQLPEGGPFRASGGTLIQHRAGPRTGGDDQPAGGVFAEI